MIFLQYCHTAEQRILLSTGVPIPPNYWNKKTSKIAMNLPSRYGNANELQISLTQKLRKAEDMVEYAAKKLNTCPVQFLKENFRLQENWKLEQFFDTEKNLDIYFNIDDYIKSKRSTVKHCTINVINAMKAHLKSFELFRKKPITFDSFDVNFTKNLLSISLMILLIQEERKLLKD